MYHSLLSADKSVLAIKTFISYHLCDINGVEKWDKKAKKQAFLHGSMKP